MTRAAPPPRLSTLILLAALSVLPVNIFLPSLANIAEAFEADYGLLSLSLAGYAAASAVLQLVMGPLSDRFGRRPIALMALTVFITASVGCALAADVWTFLTFRLLQATASAGYAVALAAIRDTSDQKQAASTIATVAAAWAVAPMLGPTLGGLLDEAMGWRAIFWGLALAGAAVLALCWFGLGETNRNRSSSLAGQFRNYPSLLIAPRFWAYAGCTAFSVGAFYAFLAGAPLVAATVFGMSPAATGLFMGTITAGFMLGSFLSSRLANRFPLTTTMMVGRVVACGGLALGLLLFLGDVGHVMALFGPCMFVGLGNGLTVPNANAGVLSVQPALAGTASGLAGALSVGGGAALSAFTGAVLTVDNAAYALLGVMLASSLLSLAAAAYARRLEGRPTAQGGSVG